MRAFKAGRASAVPLLVFLGFFLRVSAEEFGWAGTNSLALPNVGDHELRVLSPTVVELTLITTKTAETTPLNAWAFVGENFSIKLPPLSDFQVTAGGSPVAVKQLGFKQRPLYAPLKQRDLRVLSQLYLELAGEVNEGAEVVVRNPKGNLWKAPVEFKARAERLRFSPAIHVNEVGYQPEYPKKAMVGYYLGSLGELDIPKARVFEVVEADSGKSVFKGALKLRVDVGFTYSPPPYQKVFEADLSQFNTPGKYRLLVPGMGASYPFQIHNGTLATFARAYALGLYHQRCGTNNGFPFTRFVHDPCHTALAEIPTDSKEYEKAQAVIAEVSSDAKNDPRHKAPQLKSTEASLYPFVRQGKIDVTGGHHDAGDYSKYTINSAQLIHYLMFAVDSFPGVADLDNLGLPESGDGKSDVLQEAKWEADFLSKLQDADGAFYFLVYPKSRRYEDNVLPDKGDTQIVWPKNTACTAAAVAALAEAASSPAMKKQFPDAAENYMKKALRGWAFLEGALAKYGKDGAYQKLTHYGNEFGHDDELAWAAAALFVATGNKQFEKRLEEWFDPQKPDTKRWSWWPMFEGYGCAARTYAFAHRSSRLKAAQLDASFLTKCENLIRETALISVRFANESAYGTSFPDPNKANRNAGWYFSSERAFDITAAWQLAKDDSFLDAVLSNLNYEAGCNPLNVTYITGLGWRRQREIVHQYAQNDYRVLPPSGLPLGNVQGGFAYIYHYKKELGAIPYPPDGATVAPYPFYDRWGDSFNTSTEFVVVDQARSLASLAFWMAQTPLKSQPWKAAAAEIVGLPKASPAEKQVLGKLNVTGLNPSEAQVLWEARDMEPVISPELRYAPKNVGQQWVEAEALWPDGRRAFAVTNYSASASLNTPPNASLSASHQPTPETVALYHLDGDLKDSTGKNPPLALSGKVSLDESNVSWMSHRAGASLRFNDLGDKATVTLSPAALAANGAVEIGLEAMIFVQSYKGYNRGNAKILSLSEDWNSSLELGENIYEGPCIKGGTALTLKQKQVTGALVPQQWHHLSLTLSSRGYEAAVDGKVIGNASASEIGNWGKKAAVLELGNFDGWIDEVRIISKGGTQGTASAVQAVKQPEPAAAQAVTAVPVPAPAAAIPIRPYESGKVNAIFLQRDDQTHGAWETKFGKAGYKLIGGPEKPPAGFAVNNEGAAAYSWSENSKDPRALRKPGTADGLVSCWYNEKSFDIKVAPASKSPFQLTLYCLDWDRLGRTQMIEMIDPASKEVLDRQIVSNFQEGAYLTWLLSGPLDIRVTRQAGANALIMGFFFDPPNAQATTLIKSAH